MWTYGIELLEVNIAECRLIMLETRVHFLNLQESDELWSRRLLRTFPEHCPRDVLKMRTKDDELITFADG